MKKTDYSVSLRDGVRKRLKQYPRLLSQSLTASLLLLLLMWQHPGLSQGNCSLSCHGAQISLGFDCTAKVTVAMIADTSECTGGGFVVYIITLQNDTLPNATVTGAEIGTTLIASVVDTITGNSCWHYITVQDKWKPSLVCKNDTISCLELPLFTGPAVHDNCDPNPQVILINEVATLLCDPLYIKMIVRTYIARDASGNESAPCTMTLLLRRIDFSLIDFPDPRTVALGTALQCDGLWADADHDGIPDPLDDGIYLGTGVPTIEGYPIYPEFMGFCNALTTYEDVVLPQIGCVRKIMRIWTVREWHCTGERDTIYQQLIEIVDNEGPHITCPANFTQTTTGHFCTATILLQPAIVFDDCSPTTHTTVAYPGGFSPTNGGVYVSLPVGQNVITYTAYDQCYNSSTCTMTITVADLTPPVAICDAHTVVSLTLGGPHGLTKVPASVFDDGSYDACGPVTFLARRMTSCLDFDWTTGGAGVDEIPDGYVTSVDQGIVLRPKVPFACCDAGAGPIMVQLEVKDASGNVNYCMVEVIVQDKIPPVIFCPTNITVSCDYPINIDDLDEFGTVVEGSSHTNPFCIYDPTNDLANNSGFICGVDGYVIDNCGVIVTEQTYPHLNQCGVGYISRVFTAQDANGTVTCEQIITVHNFDPFDYYSINWPLDYHSAECSTGTDPDDLEPPYDRPTFTEDHCDLIGVNYEDLVFTIADGACFKILRKWTIIEWCLYGDLGGIVEGQNYWTHTQVIKVVDSFGPEFTTDQPTFVNCNDVDCGGETLVLFQSAHDICTPDNLLEACYSIDLNNDQIIDYGPFCSIGNVINTSWYFPLGNHRVIYTFEDRCGNRTVKEQFFDLNSCKAPQPVCIHGLSTDLMSDGNGGGMITIWATDFDASSSHPCGLYFTLSLAPDTLVKSLTFTCDDAGHQVPVNLYVTDKLGNQAFCTTFIIVQDNNGFCPEGGHLTGTVTGNVSTESSDNVLDVQVQLSGSTLLPIATNQAGTFTFPSMPVGGNYVVEPDKNNDFKNGVSTLDLVQIQKHLLGIKKLESPYKMIAADANNSKSITAIDLIELRKLILGIYTELPSNTSWRFVDKSYTFPDPYNPWEQVWPESVSLNPLSLGMNKADFYGIKVGDVNNTVKANAQTLVTRGSGETLDLIIDDRQVSDGETIEVPVYPGATWNLEGMQFTFDLNAGLEVVEVKGGTMDVTSENFGWIDSHTLSSSWNKAEGINVDITTPLFTLVLHAGNDTRLSQSIKITSSPTSPEAYSSDNTILDLGLKFRGADIYSFELLQNEPNPFSGNTQIGYVIPANGEVTLTLFDLAGRQLYNETVNGIKGLNKIEISKEQIGAQGLVYYQVQFQGFTATKKMMIL
ncbi:MAG: HYR domain-containing protein [Saprospiraceae bacterium]